MTTQSLILATVAVSSGATYLYASRRRRLTPRALGQALAGMLECLGMMVVFAALNVLAGLVIVALTRVLGAYFVSLHSLNNSVLLVLSACQAIAYQAWHKSFAVEKGTGTPTEQERGQIRKNP